jgi:hypothetical protein
MPNTVAHASAVASFPKGEFLWFVSNKCAIMDAPIMPFDSDNRLWSIPENEAYYSALETVPTVPSRMLRVSQGAASKPAKHQQVKTRDKAL